MTRSAAGEFGASWDLVMRAVELAGRLGLPDAQFVAGQSLLGSDQPPHRKAELWRVAEEAITWPRDGVNPSLVARVVHQCAYIFLGRGERERAEAIWRQVRQLGERTLDPDVAIVTLQSEGYLLQIDGHLEAALAVGERIASRADPMGAAVAVRIRALTIRWRPLRYLGRSSELLAALDDIAQRTGGQEERVQAGERLLALIELGRQAEAKDLLRQLVRRYGLDQPQAEHSMHVQVLVLEGATLLEDRDIVRLLAPRLAVVADVLAAPVNHTFIARHLGAAAVLLGERDRARAYYEQAPVVAGKIGFRPELALTHIGLAELDAAEGHTGAAREHLAFCIPELEAMKMRPGLEKALALRERLA